MHGFPFLVVNFVKANNWSLSIVASFNCLPSSSDVSKKSMHDFSTLFSTILCLVIGPPLHFVELLMGYIPLLRHTSVSTSQCFDSCRNIGLSKHREVWKFPMFRQLSKYWSVERAGLNNIPVFRRWPLFSMHRDEIFPVVSILIYTLFFIRNLL